MLFSILAHHRHESNLNELRVRHVPNSLAPRPNRGVGLPISTDNILDH